MYSNEEIFKHLKEDKEATISLPDTTPLGIIAIHDYRNIAGGKILVVFWGVFSNTIYSRFIDFDGLNRTDYHKINLIKN